MLLKNKSKYWLKKINMMMIKVGLIQNPKLIQIIEQIQNKKILIVNHKITKDPIKNNQIKNRAKIIIKISHIQDNIRIKIIKTNMKIKTMIDQTNIMTGDNMNRINIDNNIINMITNIRNKMIININLKIIIIIVINIEIKKIQILFNTQHM